MITAPASRNQAAGFGSRSTHLRMIAAEAPFTPQIVVRQNRFLLVGREKHTITPGNSSGILTKLTATGKSMAFRSTRPPLCLTTRSQSLISIRTTPRKKSDLSRSDTRKMVGYWSCLTPIVSSERGSSVRDKQHDERGIPMKTADDRGDGRGQGSVHPAPSLQRLSARPSPGRAILESDRDTARPK